MRTMLLTLAVSSTLIVSAGAIAAGRSMGDLPVVGAPTITVTEVGPITSGLMRPDALRSVYHEDGRQASMVWQSSDPCLSGDVTTLGDRHMNRDGSMVETEAYVVSNAGGRWTGLATGLATAQPPSDLVIGNGLLPPGPGHEDTVLLRGEGGYEGYSALLAIDWAQQPPTVSGTVFRGDLPAAPDLASIG
jgi:hypothetical protein